MSRREVEFAALPPLPKQNESADHPFRDALFRAIHEPRYLIDGDGIGAAFCARTVIGNPVVSLGGKYEVCK